MEELIKKQISDSKNFEQDYNNFKKLSQERRTNEIINENRQRVNSYKEQFENRHGEITKFAGYPKSEYNTSNFVQTAEQHLNFPTNTRQESKSFKKNTTENKKKTFRRSRLRAQRKQNKQRKQIKRF